MSETIKRPRKQLVHGELMDKKAAAKAAHVSVKKLTSYKNNHRCSLEEAYDHFKDTEAERTMAAVNDLMAILSPAWGRLRAQA